MNKKNKQRQAEIIERGDERAAYFFARDVKDADIAALQKVVIASGDCWAAYFFARDVEGADKAALRKAFQNAGI